MKLVSIAVLIYNNLELSHRWAQGVLTHMRPAYEQILVENGSSDGTTDFFRRLAAGCARVRGICRGRNYVVCARNFRVEVALGECICTLDNDRWLEGLLAPFGDPSVAATGVEGVSYDSDWQHTLQNFLPERREGLLVDVLMGGYPFCNLIDCIGAYDWDWSSFWNDRRAR